MYKVRCPSGLVQENVPRTDIRVIAAKRRVEGLITAGQVKPADAESAVRAILAGAPVRAATPDRPATTLPAVEDHEAFMLRVFPTTAAQLGYAPQYVAGFLLGSDQGIPQPGVVASSGHDSAADREHAAVMARHFPAVRSGSQHRVRIQSFS